MRTAVFPRETFRTSRMLEFFSPKELSMQIGADQARWPLALCKELIDNALDACETTDRAPVITVTMTDESLAVQDNGPGFPVETLHGVLDYSVRVSDKAHYVSPTRGQLGNALKCCFAAPYVVDGTRGEVSLTTGGTTHHLTITLDTIAQCPVMAHSSSPDGFVKTGTLFTMYWPQIAHGHFSSARGTIFTKASGICSRATRALILMPP